MTRRPEINVIGSFLVEAIVPFAPTTLAGNLYFSDNKTARVIDVGAAAIIDAWRWQLITQYANPAAAAVYLIAGVLEAATVFYIMSHPDGTGLSPTPPK